MTTATATRGHPAARGAYRAVGSGASAPAARGATSGQRRAGAGAGAPALAQALAAALATAASGAARADVPVAAGVDGLDVALGAQAQVRVVPWVGEDALLSQGDPATEMGLGIPRARVGVSGDLSDTVLFDLRAELSEGGEFRGERAAPGAHLLDALIGLRHPREAWVTGWAGVGKVPVSASALTASARLALPDRPVIVQAIAPGRRPGLTLEIDRGVQVAAGVYNATSRPGHGNEVEGHLAAARLGWGLGGSLGREETGSDLGPDASPRFALGLGAARADEADRETLLATADAALRWRRFTLRAEALWRRDQPATRPELPPSLPAEVEARGLWALAAVTLWPAWIDAVARVEVSDDNVAVDDAGDVLIATGGLVAALDRAGRVKAWIAYAHREETRAPELANDGVTLQGQVAF